VAESLGLKAKSRALSRFGTGFWTRRPSALFSRSIEEQRNSSEWARRAMYVKALLVGDAEVGKGPLARCAAGGSGQTDWDGYPTYQGLDIAEVSVSKRSPWALMDERRGKGKGKRTRKLALQDEMQRIQMPIWILHPVFDEMMPRMRSVTFQGVEVVGICYKVTDRDSLENAIHKVRIQILPYYISHRPVPVVSYDSTLPAIGACPPNRVHVRRQGSRPMSHPRVRRRSKESQS
jgi:hypothetical protein